MDDVDNLTQREETFYKYQRMQQVERAARREIMPTGRCHYCDDEINATTHVRLFCSTECRDDWEMVHDKQRR